MEAKIVIDIKQRKVKLENITEKELKYIVSLNRIKSIYLWKTAKINPQRLKIIEEKLKKGGIKLQLVA